MELPDGLSPRYTRHSSLRYGENPHQSAALYLDENDQRPGVARATLAQGKELSFNNMQDADAAYECVAEFDEPACVIVKHMNPCGVALGGDVKEAYLRAFSCDTVSAFGGIVAINRTLTASLASELVKIFLEVVIAPSADDDALALLAAKPNLRVLLTGSMPNPSEPRTILRTIAGGVLAQAFDERVFSSEGSSDNGADGLKIATKRAPTAVELTDMLFAFTVVKHVKSNAIVFAKDAATKGIGAGQMSRIYSVRVAAMKAADENISLSGSVMASDAFMPFPDCVHAAHAAGATAIIQPGGSLKDQDSIDAADSYGMAMVMTGIRHFRH